MLIDKILPHYHFSERHAIDVDADPPVIFGLVDKLDFSQSTIIKILFWLRGMARMKNRKGLSREGFVELERSDNDEVVIGLIGQFWRANGNLQKFKPAAFTLFDQPKFLKAAWNFKIVAGSSGCCIITETRVYCTDAVSRKRFALYWFFVKPFSGLIRKEILRAIKRTAEAKQNNKVVVSGSL